MRVKTLSKLKCSVGLKMEKFFFKKIFSSPQICLQAQPKSAKTQFIVWKTTIIQKLTGQQEDSKVVTDKSNYRTNRWQNKNLSLEF